MKKINLIKISTLFLPIFFTLLFNFSFSQNSNTVIDINIEWQAIDSYIPNFYKGRALPGEEAYIKAIAIVNINSISGTIDSDNLFYAWKYNDYYLYDYSDTGSKIVYFNLDQLQTNNTLELSVYSDPTKSTLLGKKTITLRPYKTLPILYKKDDNSGIITYSNALNKKYEDFRVNKDDNFKIVAEPFFFSAKNPSDTVLNYSWTIDNVFNGNIGTNIFNYFYGDTNSIELKISNKQKILQEGETLVNFNTN